MANETEIRPALTPAQWTSMHMAQVGADLEIRLTDEGSYGIRPPSLHAIAALALHQQPFGFTHADVAALRAMSGNQSQMEQPWAKTYHDIFRDLAARIEALLPPNPHP